MCECPDCAKAPVGSVPRRRSGPLYFRTRLSDRRHGSRFPRPRHFGGADFPADARDSNVAVQGSNPRGLVPAHTVLWITATRIDDRGCDQLGSPRVGVAWGCPVRKRRLFDPMLLAAVLLVLALLAMDTYALVR
jgi:hypothetical protein